MRLLAVCSVLGISLAAASVLAAERDGITIKVLYDNYAHDKALQTDWGFSCLVIGTEKTILFDTGAKGDVLLQNMANMNVAPDAVEVAVISHNHDDHTSGLLSVLDKNRKMIAYLPPSCPQTLVQQTERRGAKVVTVTKPVEVCQGVYVIGPTGDEIVEQALVVDTDKGLVVITGCSHPGVMEIAKRAKDHLGREVYMICGGMHLLDMSETQVRDVIAELKSLGVQQIGPTHCTGEKAIGLFKEAFGDGFVELGVGRVLHIKNDKTYTNPVSDTPLQMGDPFVLQHGDKYFLFGTNASNEGFKCWESPDLVQWTPKGWAYQETDASWAKSHYWAPEVKEYRGKFYLTYSAMPKSADTPRLLIALAVSDKPAGPYTDLFAPWFDFGYSAIDGHIFVDDDGKPYLYFSRNGVQDGYSFGIIYGMALAEDLSKPIGEAVKLMEADQPWEKVRYAENRCNEGAFVLKHNGRYYMTYSANHTGFPHYGIGYATADNPLGPWVKAEENPIAATNLEIGVSGPGHSCITRSPDGKELFIVYHTHADPKKPSGERVVNIDRLRFAEDGKLKIKGPTRSPQPMPSGTR